MRFVNQYYEEIKSKCIPVTFYIIFSFYEAYLKIKLKSKYRKFVFYLKKIHYFNIIFPIGG